MRPEAVAALSNNFLDPVKVRCTNLNKKRNLRRATRTVSIKRKRFITLSLGDLESRGYDEYTLPMLLQLVEASAPDYRNVHALVTQRLTPIKPKRSSSRRAPKRRRFPLR